MFTDTDTRSTIARALVLQADRLESKALLVNVSDGSQLSYRQLVSHADAASARLHERGIAAGSMAAIYLGNGIDFVKSCFACLFAGVVNVALNPDFRKTTLLFGLQTVGAAVLFTDEAGVDNLLDEELRPFMPQLKLVVLAGQADLAACKQRFARIGAAPDMMSLSELIAPGLTPGSWQQVDATLPAVVRFTSGTTGPPKGIVQSNLHVLNKCAMHNRIMDYGESDILYSPFPLHHGLASVMGLIGTISAGGTMVTSPKFSASRFWQEAAQTGATLGHLLQPLVPLIETQDVTAFERSHQVRSLYTAPPNRRFEERFKSKFVQSYSMGEVGIIAFKLGAADGDTSSGLPLPEMEVQIVDELDRPMPGGELGEIVVRPRLPHQVMIGYINNLPATQRAFRNLWYHTGDSGLLDDKGELHFIGRLGDTIRRRGVNISSEQIETEIRLYPMVKDCAVIGVPSATGEHELHACIEWTRAPDDVGRAMEMLLDFLIERLPKTYVPRYLEHVGDLPRTPTGKIQKAQLRTRKNFGPTWERDRGRWTLLQQGDTTP